MDNPQRTTDRILLLIDRQKNKELLREWLSQRYDVLEVPPGELANEFDLAILDGTSLDRHWEELQRRKEADLPLLLPILFITPRSDINMVTRHLWRTVDELILTPIEKIELIARVEILLRARRLSQNLQTANKIKLNFLAMISHELRTPLTSIKGFASSLLAPDLTFSASDQREFFQIIDDEANNMQELIDQLLDLSRLQAGTFRIAPRSTHLNDVIFAASPQLESITHQHVLDVNVDPTLPTLEIDPARVGQVLVNLVGNAAKFAPEGTPIRISAAPVDRAIQIDVCDHGPGIPSADHNAIFEAFRQLDKGSHKKGAGLGLAICKALVEAHGGRIWVDPAYTDGTMISFALPLPPTIVS